jgi:ABC-type multidrug transport system fused ATPase/permease subunit
VSLAASGLAYGFRDRVVGRGVELALVPGEVACVLGPNGSGKTTLLALLPRLFDPSGGRVTIDGRDVREVDLRSLRDQIAVVTQDTVLFKGSIRANIAYGRHAADDEAVRNAARRAHAEEFIAALPAGYQTELGEGGVGLSGGQRQRLAIARAILRDPAILILDEATSMIDAESEHHIAAAIDEFVTRREGGAGRRTCLIVAHRLSTVMHADMIVVMDRGKIVDTGRHAELLARCELYRALASRQLGA